MAVLILASFGVHCARSGKQSIGDLIAKNSQGNARITLNDIEEFPLDL